MSRAAIIVALLVCTGCASAQPALPNDPTTSRVAQRLVELMFNPELQTFQPLGLKIPFRLLRVNPGVQPAALSAAASQYIWPAVELELARCRELIAQFFAATTTLGEIQTLSHITDRMSDEVLNDAARQRANQLFREASQHAIQNCRSPLDVIESAIQQHQDALLVLGINPERPVRNVR